MGEEIDGEAGGWKGGGWRLGARRPQSNVYGHPDELQ